MPFTTRKLEVFKLHGRTETGTLNYKQFFAALGHVPPDERARERGSRLLAFPVLSVSQSTAWLITYEGDVGVNPLIFSSSQARERVQRLRSGEVVAYKTHVLINLTSREVIVEYNHRGAKANDIIWILEEIGRSLQGYDSLSLELNPVADEGFISAMDRFERIRLASLRVARPNIDWTDHYDNLNAVAADSEARTAEIELTAHRGGSLSKTRGIVRFIRDLARGTHSILKSARLTGVREGESESTTLSLSHHIEHQKIRARVTHDGHIDDEHIKKKMQDFLSARSRRSS